jgi:hypothetical protein
LGLDILDLGLDILDLGLDILDLGLDILDLGLDILDLGLDRLGFIGWFILVSLFSGLWILFFLDCLDEECLFFDDLFTTLVD